MASQLEDAPTPGRPPPASVVTTAAHGSGSVGDTEGDGDNATEALTDGVAVAAPAGDVLMPDVSDADRDADIVALKPTVTERDVDGEVDGDDDDAVCDDDAVRDMLRSAVGDVEAVVSADALPAGDGDGDWEGDGATEARTDGVAVALLAGVTLGPCESDGDGVGAGVPDDEIAQLATTERTRFPICCATIRFPVTSTETLRGHANAASVPAPST